MFELKYTLTFEDYQIFLAILHKRQRKNGLKRYALSLGILLVLFAFLLVLDGTAPLDLLNWDNGRSLIFFGILFVAFRRYGVPILWRRNFKTQKIGDYPLEVWASDKQLRTLQNGVETLIDWRRIMEVTRSEGRMLLWMGPMQSLVIPERAFASPQQADAFNDYVTARMNDTIK